MPLKFHVCSYMGTNFFWQFILGTIIATVAAIHGHMTSKVDMVTKDHEYLLNYKFER